MSASADDDGFAVAQLTLYFGEESAAFPTHAPSTHAYEVFLPQPSTPTD